jgi:hypothetical protein
VNEVLGRIGCRQGDRDDEVRRGKAEQDEDERLAAPARQQVFEHRDAALTVRARLGDAAVDGQRANERQRDENDGRNRRQRAGREKRDARLIPQRREVIDPREAHDFPPRCGMGV